MLNFKIRFNAKPSGASINAFRVFEREIQAVNIEHAIFKLYDSFDQIRLIDFSVLTET